MLRYRMTQSAMLLVWDNNSSTQQGKLILFGCAQFGHAEGRK
jgi:hypothetical protein